ncbi:hypothetical protein [Bacillus thuringiensis]|uniref:hypothetical protein n=1 Tax=Bacillus thuringiensis TaxID=1428 RepID=UPI001122A024|nr:hypothetical protein [Bacillus thuringiensis]
MKALAETGAFSMSPFGTDKHILKCGDNPSLGYCSFIRNSYSHEEHPTGAGALFVLDEPDF